MPTTTTKPNVTVTINGQTVSGDIATVTALLNGMVHQESKAAKAEKRDAAAKREAKREKVDAVKSKHDAILDSKRVQRMTKTALDKLQAAGFGCKARKQGKWMWVYPTDSRGRAPEFKAVKLPKGWKHSMKRGAYYRDFSEQS